MENPEFMKRAIELAKLGEGWCHPNPLVGAVIVKEGRIIGEGYHARYGELHAERQAFRNLTEDAVDATIYVTLEPCCHHGKQPPCTEAIINHGIKRVIIGSRDPNPLVSGKGVAILREQGIEVVEDYMREECDLLNPVFFHYIKTKKPYVTMKYAMTLDGKIATRTGESKWISGEASRQRVQEMRHAAMGIMAGIGTVLKDDPMLNCRMPDGKSPIRIICDSNLRLPLSSKILKTAEEYETIVVCALPEISTGVLMKDTVSAGSDELKAKLTALLNAGAEVINCPDKSAGKVDLQLLMRILGERGIDSILLEGGGILNEAALRAGVVQEIDAFLAPKIFGGDGKTPVLGQGVLHPEDAYRCELLSIEHIDKDLLLRFRV